MKTCTFAIMFGCLVTSMASAAPGGKVLNWQKDYGAVKRLAQASQRPMLLIIENSADQQKTLDVSKLQDEQRAILDRDKFELVRVDANTDYGKAVAEAFGAKVFPYTVVTDDASKRIVFRKPGVMTEQDWTLALAKDIRSQLTSGQATTNSGTYSLNYGFSTGGGIVIQQPASVSGTCFT